MANNKSFIVLIFVLCLNLISTNIYAANLGGWSLGNPIAQGASAIVNGTKTAVINGANVIKNSTAKITPPASAVAKVLARGVAGYALSVAVEQLLGSVDWVLDPANNRIKYYEETSDTVLYYRVMAGGDWKNYSTFNEAYYAASSSPSCSGSISVSVPWTAVAGPTVEDQSYICSNSGGFVIRRVLDTTTDKEEKYLPLPTAAQQVISNAESGDSSAQQATVAAAQDIINDAQNDDVKARPIVQQLDQNAQTVSSEDANKVTGQTKPNTQNPDAIDISLEFPVFCGWAPLVCEAAQTVISFPATLTEWWQTANKKAEEWALSISEAWTAAKEWATKEKDSEDTEVDIEELDLEAESVDINLASGCPAPVVFIDSDFYGQPFKIEFSFDGFCSILSDWVRPILISLGAFIAALILGGVKVNE